MATTKRLGRPPKKPEDLRTAGILVKMTQDEHATILALAKHTRRRAASPARRSRPK